MCWEVATPVPQYNKRAYVGITVGALCMAGAGAGFYVKKRRRLETCDFNKRRMIIMKKFIALLLLVSILALTIGCQSSISVPKTFDLVTITPIAGEAFISDDSDLLSTFREALSKGVRTKETLDIRESDYIVELKSAPAPGGTAKVLSRYGLWLRNKGEKATVIDSNNVVYALSSDLNERLKTIILKNTPIPAPIPTPPVVGKSQPFEGYGYLHGENNNSLSVYKRNVLEVYPLSDDAKAYFNPSSSSFLGLEQGDFIGFFLEYPIDPITQKAQPRIADVYKMQLHEGEGVYSRVYEGEYVEIMLENGHGNVFYIDSDTQEYLKSIPLMSKVAYSFFVNLKDIPTILDLEKK